MTQKYKHERIRTNVHMSSTYFDLVIKYNDLYDMYCRVKDKYEISDQYINLHNTYHKLLDKYNELLHEIGKLNGDNSTLQANYDKLFTEQLELINENHRLRHENAKFVTDINSIKQSERSFSKYDELLAEANRLKMDLDIQVKDKKQLSEEVDRLANCCIEKDNKIKSLLQSLREVIDVVLYKQDKDEKGEF
jgi:uncharacterized protein (DUF3084 family)